MEISCVCTRPEKTHKAKNKRCNCSKLGHSTTISHMYNKKMLFNFGTEMKCGTTVRVPAKYVDNRFFFVSICPSIKIINIIAPCKTKQNISLQYNKKRKINGFILLLKIGSIWYPKLPAPIPCWIGYPLIQKLKILEKEPILYLYIGLPHLFLWD